MTASKPEVVAYYCPNNPDAADAFSWKNTRCDSRICDCTMQPLIRLADHDSAAAADKVRIAELEADAARYRWLRDHSQSFHTFYLSVPIWMTGVSVNQEKVDRSIDAAIALAQQEQPHDSE